MAAVECRTCDPLCS